MDGVTCSLTQKYTEVWKYEGTPRSMRGHPWKYEGTPIILHTSGNINGTNRYKIPGVHKLCGGIIRRSVIGH